MNSSVNSSYLENIIDPTVSYTFNDLATLFNSELNSYLLTILIIGIIYTIYNDDLKEYVTLFSKWLSVKIENKFIKKFVIELPDSLNWSLGYLSFTGFGILVYIYGSFLTFTQKVILFIITLFLIYRRTVQFLLWVSHKIINYYVNKQLGETSDMIQNILQENGNELEDNIKNIKKVN